jgi:hypothetical protein
LSLTALEVYETIGRMNKSGGLSAPLSMLGVTAQTFHETGNYKHTCGKDNFNLAGVKCSANWLDGRIPWSTRRCTDPLKTQEFVSGKYGDYKLTFRWYDSLETYLKDHARLINLYYPVSKANADCVWGYVAGLQGKWATSPAYFQSLVKAVIRLAPELLEYDWHERLKNAFICAVQRNVLSPAQTALLHNSLM